MRHDCEHCATRYEIPDEKAAGRFLKVRCQKCRQTMHVVGLRAFDAGCDGAVWWCAVHDRPLGPYRESEILQLADAGDVHARTRMWCAGMSTWERVAESAHLAWVYSAIIEHVTPTTAYDRAALLSDGRGYFPDPTLHSGVILLDDETQQQLADHAKRAARRRAQGTRAEERSMLGTAMAAAVGAVAAASGIAWFVLGAAA